MVALRVLTGSFKVGGCTSFMTSPFFQHTPSKERDVCNEKREWIVKKERVSHPPPRSPHAGDTRIHRISIEKIAGKFGAQTKDQRLRKGTTISDNSAKARGKGLNATLHAKFAVLTLAESVFRSARAGVTAVTCSLQNNKTSHQKKKRSYAHHPAFNQGLHLSSYYNYYPLLRCPRPSPPRKLSYQTPLCSWRGRFPLPV